MYKDKEKQREANKRAKARFMAKQAGKNAPGLARIDDLPVEGIPRQGIPEGIPGIPKQGIPQESNWCDGIPGQPKVQHFNPMMIGYEPLPKLYKQG